MHTIYDIARRVGVSAATVSRALNNSGYVKKEVRKRILAVASELDYHPNTAAQSLTRKQTYTIGLIIPDITNPFFPAVARGVEDAASQEGYNVVLCNTDGDRNKEIAYIKMLRSKRVDGLIFIGAHVQVENLTVLKKAGIPVVVADRQAADDEIDTVYADNVSGARMAVEYLISLGYEIVAHISGPRGLSTGLQRRVGYLEALLLSGRSEGLISEGDFRRRSGYEGMKELLTKVSPPFGLFAGNDLMAIGAITALEEQGLRVPDDVSVVGFDDIDVASIVRPRLTTVQQPKYEMGQVAMRLLLGRMVDSTRPPEHVNLESKLIVRESTLRKDSEPCDRGGAS